LSLYYINPILLIINEKENNMTTRLNAKNEKGFTLIELMIVIAIIGILAAIAIPQFSAYRARSYNAASLSDLRNLMTACEGYYIDHNNQYPNEDPFAAGSDLRTNYGFTPSPGVIGGTIIGDSSSYTIADVSNTLAVAQAVSYSVVGPGAAVVTTAP
jgi:type IV pilus assembly protein PilA